MEKPLSYPKIAPEAYHLMLEFEAYAKKTTLDPKLIELIKIRASQLNGCAFCLDMHTREARKMGESEQRIYCLSAWREAPFYSDEERVALALTETVTQISTRPFTEDLYFLSRQFFDERQYVDLIYIINTINSWNRLAIATGSVPSADHS